MLNDNFTKFLAVYMAATLRIMGQAHAHAVCFLLLPPPDKELTIFKLITHWSFFTDGKTDFAYMQI